MVSLLAGAEAHMKSRGGWLGGKFVWVPNGVSDERNTEARLNLENISHPIIERINRMREQGKRVVLYAGGMGPPNAMEVIVDAAIRSRHNQSRNLFYADWLRCLPCAT